MIRIFPSKGLFYRIHTTIKEPDPLNPTQLQHVSHTENLAATIGAISVFQPSAVARADLGSLIVGTSVAGGTVGFDIQDLVALITGTSSVVPVVSPRANLATLIQGQSILAGVVIQPLDMMGSIAAVSTVPSTVLTGDIESLLSTIGGISTLSGELAGSTSSLASLIGSASQFTPTLQSREFIRSVIEANTTVGASVFTGVVTVSFTIFLANGILNHVLGTSPLTQDPLWIGLFTTPPTKTGGGVEVNVGSYQRVPLPSMTASVNGMSASSADVQFPEADQDWGTLQSVGLFNSASGGNLCMFASPTTAFILSEGTTLKFPAGSITVQLS